MYYIGDLVDLQELLKQLARDTEELVQQAAEKQGFTSPALEQEGIRPRIGGIPPTWALDPKLQGPMENLILRLKNFRLLRGD